jgi:hypothetical protein
MTALAGDLFRVSTVLILVPEPEGESLEHGARPLERMREELRRLGLGKDEVELLQYPQRGSPSGR